MTESDETLPLDDITAIVLDNGYVAISSQAMGSMGCLGSDYSLDRVCAKRDSQGMMLLVPFSVS